MFCEEAIEHLSFAQAGGMVDECRRVLKPGGILRISTPDLRYYAGLLTRETSCCDTFSAAQAELHYRCEFPPSSAATRQVAAINAVFLGHGHKFLYDFECLKEALIEHGFMTVKLSRYKDEASQLGRWDSHADRFRHPPEISLYVECCKPE